MKTATEALPLAELVAALEQATQMAKQFPSTTDPSQILQIYAGLQAAHHHLSCFLSQTSQPPPQFIPPPAAAENSVSSAVGGGGEDETEPMQVGDGDDEVETEQNSKTTLERVEERMRDFFIQNKRPKRPLSPSSAAAGQNFLRVPAEFDPYRTRLSSLELICQFHA